MIDKGKIVDFAKNTLPADLQIQSQRLDESYGFAVIDLANKFIDEDRMTFDTETVANNARTVVIDGSNQDLDKLFYIRYGTGDDQKLLTYIPLSEFLKEYSSPSAEAATPTYYTLLGLDDSTGKPKIKFDVPASAATTMEVYYFRDVNPNLIKNNMAPALMNATLAYFFGIGNDAGARYYQVYRANISDVRANANRVVDKESRFIQNPTDRNIAAIRRGMKGGRL